MWCDCTTKQECFGCRPAKMSVLVDERVYKTTRLNPHPEVCCARGQTPSGDHAAHEAPTWLCLNTKGGRPGTAYRALGVCRRRRSDPTTTISTAGSDHAALWLLRARGTAAHGGEPRADPIGAVATLCESESASDDDEDEDDADADDPTCPSKIARRMFGRAREEPSRRTDLVGAVATSASSSSCAPRRASPALRTRRHSERTGLSGECCLVRHCIMLAMITQTGRSAR